MCRQRGEICMATASSEIYESKGVMVILYPGGEDSQNEDSDSTR